MVMPLWVSFGFFCDVHISGAKFGEHCFNISRYILYSVFYHFSCKPQDVITFLPLICIIQNVNISKKEKKRYSKKGNAILLCFEKPF